MVNLFWKYRFVFFFLQNLGRFCSITWFNFLLLTSERSVNFPYHPHSLCPGYMCLGVGDPAISPFPGSTSLLFILMPDPLLLCPTPWRFRLLVRYQYIPLLIIGYLYGLLLCTLSLPFKHRLWGILRAFPLLPCLAECNTHQQMD